MSVAVPAAAPVLITAAAVAAVGGELTGREGDSAEQFTGILGAAGIVAAFLGGDGVVQHRHDELCVPLQTDDGELAQGHIEPAAVRSHDQVIIEEPLNGGGDLDRARVGPVADIPDPGAEDHGIQYFHHPHQFAGWI